MKSEEVYFYNISDKNFKEPSWKREKTASEGTFLWREIDFVKLLLKAFRKFLQNIFRNISTKSFELIQATVSRILLKNIKGAP